MRECTQYIELNVAFSKVAHIFWHIFTSSFWIEFVLFFFVFHTEFEWIQLANITVRNLSITSWKNLNYDFDRTFNLIFIDHCSFSFSRMWWILLLNSTASCIVLIVNCSRTGKGNFMYVCVKHDRFNIIVFALTR